MSFPLVRRPDTSFGVFRFHLLILLLGCFGEESWERWLVIVVIELVSACCGVDRRFLLADVLASASNRVLFDEHGLLGLRHAHPLHLLSRVELWSADEDCSAGAVRLLIIKAVHHAKDDLLAPGMARDAVAGIIREYRILDDFVFEVACFSATRIHAIFLTTLLAEIGHAEGRQCDLLQRRLVVHLANPFKSRYVRH